MTRQRSFLAPYLLVGTELKRDLYINVEDGVIRSVDADPAYPDSTVDFGADTITYPACVNTHSHAFQALFRGSVNDLDLMTWLKRLYKQAESATPEDIYRGARLAFTEMLGNGITSVSDFFYVNGMGNENAHEVIRAAMDVGIRLNFNRVIMDNPVLAPQFREDLDTGLSRYEELVAAYPDSDRLTIGLAPHSIYYSSEAILEAAHEQALEEGKKWHMHYSDSRSTRDIALEKYGRSETQHLHEAGLLGPNFVGVHGIWADEEDIALLAETGAHISHNPISNRFIGEPLPDVYTMLEKGVNVGMGTDGAASSPSLSVFEEVKHALIGQKSRHQDPEYLSMQQGLELATVNGAAITGFNSGQLATGYLADFMVCDATHPCLVPIENALSHFVYSLPSQAIRKVAVGGEFLVERDAP